MCQKKELVCVFPFRRRKSLEIKKGLQNAIERTLPYCKLKVIFTSPSKIANHFRFKDVLPKKLWLLKKLCSGIVSSLKCTSYNTIYYGKTKRHFHFYVRGTQHIGISHLKTNVLKMLSNQLIQITLLSCDCNIKR